MFLPHHKPKSNGTNCTCPTTVKPGAKMSLSKLFFSGIFVIQWCQYSIYEFCPVYWCSHLLPPSFKPLCLFLSQYSVRKKKYSENDPEMMTVGSNFLDSKCFCLVLLYSFIQLESKFVLFITTG